MSKLTKSQIDKAKDLKILKPADWMTNDVKRNSWYNVVTIVAKDALGDAYGNAFVASEFYDIAEVPN